MTSKIPSSIVNKEQSNVPPPISKINTFFSPSLFLSNPYAIAAAVGSLIIRRGFSPAIKQASLVEFLCESLKYAGTVTTASVTVSPRYASAISFILVKTMDEISSGLNDFCSPLYSTLIWILPSLLSTSNGNNFNSA